MNANPVRFLYHSKAFYYKYFSSRSSLLLYYLYVIFVNEYFCSSVPAMLPESSFPHFRRLPLDTSASGDFWRLSSDTDLSGGRACWSHDTESSFRLFRRLPLDALASADFPRLSSDTLASSRSLECCQNPVLQPSGSSRFLVPGMLLESSSPDFRRQPGFCGLPEPLVRHPGKLLVPGMLPDSKAQDFSYNTPWLLWTSGASHQTHWQAPWCLEC